PPAQTLQIDRKGLTTSPQLWHKSTASRAPASQATSFRNAGRHHLGISGRLRRNLQTGSRRHRRSRRKASLTERARCYACPGRTTPQRYPAGLLPCFFRLIIGGRSVSSRRESREPQD